jgi:hypothetical protein
MVALPERANITRPQTPKVVTNCIVSNLLSTPVSELMSTYPASPDRNVRNKGDDLIATSVIEFLTLA